ncbi:mRNA-decapping enzyme subunit 2 [Kalmusia sp. IMI 367209]|nr:mRNA-decapping enzyme subunit 2 [Kalmusia sp. IMI 367209]
MTSPNLSLLDWLDDLCVRFIVNLPHEELQSVERICFQIEEAQWFYEDFIRPLDPSLPSMNLRVFSQRMFQHCPLFAGFSEHHHAEAYQHFLQYKTRVPVRGAIMLNEDMTHAVLVKGWKKGAKWSFPRGKINKDEPDLECAIREVYEETGYDLKEADLVPPENETKSIAVNMREQSMLLYVFRGVPMDTHFEPRTRKEISKIDWYKLSDLPTLKRKNQIQNQNQVQQGTGQDGFKDNSFYMVAPFLGPLKAWIKLQRKQDRQKAQAGSRLAPPPTGGITDTEGLEADLGETTADEVAIPEKQVEDANFAALVANLGRSHRPSDTLPEVSMLSQPQQVADPAAELKRLLSVGGGFPSQAQPVEAPPAAQDPPPNSLLAMLHGNNRPVPPPEHLPRTPFEQILPLHPQPPQSPHGQHHPRPPHLGQMQPPPPFPFHQPQGVPFHGPQHAHLPPQHHNGFPPPPPHQFAPPPSRHVDPVFPTHTPNVQQNFNAPAPPPYQRTGDPQFTQPPQFPGAHGPTIPPASKLPPPKLTAHTLGLLNAFKMNEKPAISSPIAQMQPPQSSEATPIAKQAPSLPQQLDSFVSPPTLHSIRPYAPSPPAFQSPPPVANFQPVQPKPRNAHQDSLLNLFRSPSTTATTPEPQMTPEQPAELSAYPSTPGNFQANHRTETGPPIPDMSIKPNLLNAFSIQQKPGLTSATVRGPVNAPDFETVKKNAHYPLNGHSRGPSPSQTKPEQKMFIPSQILKRESSVPRPNAALEPSRSVNTSPATAVPSAAPFKPQILKRPQQSTSQESVQSPSAHTQGLLNLFKNQTSPQPQTVPAGAPLSRSPAPATQAPQSFERRDTLPSDQKNALLSLFGKPSAPLTASPTQDSRSPLAPMAVNPLPPARSPQPPTPKMFMSGVISPVSPLPGSQTDSPAQLNSRSRISSIGDTMPPSIVIPPTTAPTSFPQMPLTQRNGFGGSMDDVGISPASNGLSELSIDKGKGKIGTESSGKSPVDKTFLLGFLNDVARKGR